MMDKLAQHGENGMCTPIPFHYISSTITCKVVVYTPPERADTVPLPLFILYPYMYSVPLTLQLDKQELKIDYAF